MTSLSSAISAQLSTNLKMHEITLFVIKQTLKQIAYDHSLSYKDLKIEYLPMDLLPSAILIQASPLILTMAELIYCFVKQTLKQVAHDHSLSYQDFKIEYLGPTPIIFMKRDELVKKCELLGISTDGTISQLRSRVRENEKATRIQKVFRGHVTRKWLKRRRICLKIMEKLSPILYHPKSPYMQRIFASE